jgi:hypothetical protein
MKEIPLTQGKVTWVDDEDYERFKQWNWHAWLSRSGRYYAVRKDKVLGKQVTVWLHREILGLGRNRKIQVDHINRDSLDKSQSESPNNQ